jgi:hypothetical protein
VAERLKSPAVAAWTTRVTTAVRLRELLVPVMVSAKLPVGVVLLVVTVRAELLPVVGLKLPVAPDGSTLRLKATEPVKPPVGLTVTL